MFRQFGRLTAVWLCSALWKTCHFPPEDDFIESPYDVVAGDNSSKA